MNAPDLDTLRTDPDAYAALIARARRERSLAVARIASAIFAGLKARLAPGNGLGRTLARIG